MVDHDISNGVTADCIVPSADISFSPTETHMADQHIMRVYPNRLPSHDYTIPGSRLPGNCNVRCTYNEWGLQTDDTGYIEDNDTRPALFARFAQSSWTVIFQAGNDIYFTAT